MDDELLRTIPVVIALNYDFHVGDVCVQTFLEYTYGNVGFAVLSCIHKFSEGMFCLGWKRNLKDATLPYS